VTGLRGTGSDPLPSPERQYLLAEMQRRGVDSPNTVLASPDTSLVLLRGYLRPGIQRGDRFDIEVRVPSRSETKSLLGGYLLEVPMREMAVLEGALREGRVLAAGEGPVLVDPNADPDKDPIYATRGVILGGGVSRTSRTVGLVLKPQHQSVFNSARIQTVVNRRFSLVHRGIQEGVAKAKTDEYIELKVHPRYKDNIERYLAVIRAIPLKDDETDRVRRISELQQQLMNPDTAAAAALKLEAMGNPAVAALKEALPSPLAPVRFYAAEALAYLDCPDAAPVLGQIARDEPAFRVYALSALGTLNDLESVEQLRSMLASPSAETRYGAFRALSTLNPNDPVIMGERLGDRFWYHVLNVDGPAMVHVTKSRRPELVVFGSHLRLDSPPLLEAGNRIMVTGREPGKIVVSKFTPNEPDQKRFVSDDLDEVIRAVVELGGTYPEVVQMLQQAKAGGYLTARFEVDALPEAGRRYSPRNSTSDEQFPGPSAEKGQDASMVDGGSPPGEGPPEEGPVAEGTAAPKRPGLLRRLGLRKDERE
ncbi:MAG: hypothetical protein GYA33_09265, partial [Thermogutta sp.]|nr:hypothetical protein [Thermogutta sp.]